MFQNRNLIVEERQAVDERQVEGLILLCKEMANKNHVDKMALLAIPFDPQVVTEAKRRIMSLQG